MRWAISNSSHLNALKLIDIITKNRYREAKEKNEQKN